ncbi:acyl carrier protein [Hoeflea prorocentri]|uniref:Acyl carrier protein n=1 Tax=Hoeflea prorocentri TaxID=1922333 RepID=A0A9X3UNJ1_9HYPH|nr:acyl carrier protein [Hoeflea prorocentri]MCY6382504.1 acyl carrier protein [Hoeflea prorocentri]MDA5400304.1 acyl carrier protein [Hoeflea prorocentri]
MRNNTAHTHLDDSVSAVRQMVADILLMPVERVDCHCELAQLPDWDSIVHLTLLMVIEERTGTELDIRKLKSTSSVAEVARMLDRPAATLH